MSSRLLFPGLLCALALTACGGASRSSPASATSSATSTSANTSSATTASKIDTTTSSTATTIKTSVTLPHTRSRTHTQTQAAPPPATGPRVPATFTVAAGGTLTPPQISVPTSYRVQLTFLDHGAAVTVRVLTPHPLTLNVPAGGEASKLISGLPKGTYPIAVNGATRGSLVIGSAPGP